MPKKVAVTGIGMISGMGNNIEETLSSILNQNSGVGEMKILTSNLKGVVPISEVKYSEAELRKVAKVTEEGVWSRTDYLGIIAVAEALKSAQITDISTYRTGLISATSVGGMDKFEPFFADFVKNGAAADWDKFLHHDPGRSTEKIAEHFGITEFMTTISTACSSSANSIMLGARLINNGMLDRVIVGGTDALANFTVSGFFSLKILDTQKSQPFDQNRRGLNLGEGAGFLILESEEASKDKEKLCYLSGYSNTNDAFHQTASSPDGVGARLAMENALKGSGLSPSDISYINVHGTGTGNNDLTEGLAMKAIFGDDLPPFSSTKPFTGHTLGAAGGIEAVLSVIAIQKNWMYPSLNFETPIEELGISPLTTLQEGKQVDHVLSNSFGFGGNSSTLIFSRN